MLWAGPRRWRTSRTRSSTTSRQRGSRGSGSWASGRPAPSGGEVSLSNPKLVEECRRDLPDLRDQDVSGSPFAITAYRVHDDFGGDAALARLRTRLTRRGLKLLLDFVPNHTAPRPPVGHEPPGVLRARQRGGSRGRAAELRARRAGAAGRAGADPRVRPRSVLRRLAGHVPAQLPSRRLPRGADRRAGRDREPLRRRPLRHGDAAATADHPAHLGRSGAPGRRLAAQGRSVLARGVRRHPAAAPAVPVHRRGVLGHGVGAATGGLRLHLRQAPLRPADRGRGDAGARAPVCGRRVPGSFAALPGEPRRAAGRGGVSAGDAQGRGGGRADGARAALHPRGRAGGTPRARVDAPRAAARRADRHGPADVLPAPARVPAASGAARRRVAARERSRGVARQPDAPAADRVVMAVGRTAAADRGQLRPVAGPGLRRRRDVGAARARVHARRSAGRRALHAHRRRSRERSPLPRHAALGDTTSSMLTP